MPNALVVDDDPATLSLLSSLLERRGFSTRTAASLAEARQNLEPPPDICMVDLRLPDGDGTELLRGGLAARSDFVVLTGHATVESSVEAMRLGAFDYLAKPLTAGALDRLLARFGRSPRTGEDAGHRTPAIVGESPEIKRLQQTLARIGPTDATVLIIGESGTGKELIAARLHELSPRARGRYLALNCGAVSPNLIESELFGHEKGSFTGASRQHAGYFERAHGGTLFLDEITEMPLELQVRLLRVLESRRVSRVGSSESIPVNVRVIAATNRDPQEAVDQRKLREDLLYRLQVVPIEVPPLRKRAGDVRVLAAHFLTDLNRTAKEPKTFSESMLARLEQYYWPGNVRELFNVVQRAYIMTTGRVISDPGPLHGPVWSPDAGREAPLTVRLGDSLCDVEQRLILHTVRHCRTQDEAARMLGISTKTLYNKLRLYESQRRTPDAKARFSDTRPPASRWT
jgi:two-component system response regulator AtoC